jgi:hypothetical protein
MSPSVGRDFRPDRRRDDGRSMKHVITFARVVLTAVAFLSFWFGAFVMVAFCSDRALAGPARPAIERAAACQRALQRFHAVPRLHAGRGSSTSTPAPIGPPRPQVRHDRQPPDARRLQAIAAIYGRIACVAKTPLFRAPVVGWCCGRSPTSTAGRGRVLRRDDGRPGARSARESMPVLVFPRGRGRRSTGCARSCAGPSRSPAARTSPSSRCSSVARPRRSARGGHGTISPSRADFTPTAAGDKPWRLAG